MYKIQSWTHGWPDALELHASTNSLLLKPSLTRANTACQLEKYLDFAGLQESLRTPFNSFALDFIPSMKDCSVDVAAAKELAAECNISFASYIRLKLSLLEESLIIC